MGFFRLSVSALISEKCPTIYEICPVESDEDENYNNSMKNKSRRKKNEKIKTAYQYYSDCLPLYKRERVRKFIGNKGE